MRQGAHAVYRFEVEEPGTYTGWLRYGSKQEIPLQVALDPADHAAPEFDRATLQPTGGYIGEGIWRRAQEPLEEVHPDWLDEVEDYQRPDWYEEPTQDPLSQRARSVVSLTISRGEYTLLT